MERNPGIPTGYFDLVLSVYALGWTNDLPRTLMHVTNYLRPGVSANAQMRPRPNV
jgi:hypothetical protein